MSRHAGVQVCWVFSYTGCLVVLGVQVCGCPGALCVQVHCVSRCAGVQVRRVSRCTGCPGVRAVQVCRCPGMMSV